MRLARVLSLLAGCLVVAPSSAVAGEAPGLSPEQLASPGFSPQERVLPGPKSPPQRQWPLSSDRYSDDGDWDDEDWDEEEDEEDEDDEEDDWDQEVPEDDEVPGDEEVPEDQDRPDGQGFSEDQDFPEDEEVLRRQGEAEKGDFQLTPGSDKRNASRPSVAIRGAAGYANYYLSFALVGVDVDIQFIPQLSLDLGLELWGLFLRQGDDLELRARVLPSFHVGASYRHRLHPVIQPFVGGGVGSVLYAHKVELSGREELVNTPLFALVLAARVGSDFMVTKNFGLFVAARIGVAVSGDLEQDGIPDVQQYVNEAWDPVRAMFNVRVGALGRF